MPSRVYDVPVPAAVPAPTPSSATPAAAHPCVPNTTPRSHTITRIERTVAMLPSGTRTLKHTGDVHGSCQRRGRLGDQAIRGVAITPNRGGHALRFGGRHRRHHVDLIEHFQHEGIGRQRTVERYGQVGPHD